MANICQESLGGCDQCNERCKAKRGPKSEGDCQSRMDRRRHHQNPKFATAGLACVAKNVRTIVATKFVQISIRVEMDFVRRLALLISANVNILVRTVKLGQKF